MISSETETLLELAKGLDAEKNDPTKSEFSILGTEASGLPMAVLLLEAYLAFRIMTSALIKYGVPLQSLTNKYLENCAMSEECKAKTRLELSRLLQKQVNGSRWAPGNEKYCEY